MSNYRTFLEKFHSSLAQNLPLKYVHYLTSLHKKNCGSNDLPNVCSARVPLFSLKQHRHKLYLVELASYNDMTRITDVNSIIIQNYVWKWKTWNALKSDFSLWSISFTSDCNKARSESWTSQCLFCIKINQIVTLEHNITEHILHTFKGVLSRFLYNNFVFNSVHSFFPRLTGTLQNTNSCL